jgi:DNA-directed RNA polymerase subunit beta'
MSRNLEDKGKSSGVLVFGPERMTLVTSDEIRRMSSGKVTRPALIVNMGRANENNPPRPSRGGLYSEKIFGPAPIKLLRKGSDERGRIISVFVPELKPFKLKTGHIELSYPVLHPYFYKKIPSPAAGLLGLGANILKDIIHMRTLMVTESDDPGTPPGRLVRRTKLKRFVKERPRAKIRLESGARLIRKLLSRLDLPKIIKEESEKLEGGFKTPLLKRRSLLKYKFAKAFLESGISPAAIVMDAVPVLPVSERPLVLMDGGRDTRKKTLNNIYLGLLETNKEAELAFGGRKVRGRDFLPDKDLRNIAQKYQRLVCHLYGQGKRVRRTVVRDEKKR